MVGDDHHLDWLPRGMEKERKNEVINVFLVNEEWCDVIYR